MVQVVNLKFLCRAVAQSLGLDRLPAEPVRAHWKP